MPHTLYPAREKTDPVLLGVEHIVKLLLIAAVLLGIVRMDILMVIVSFGILLLTFIPQLTEKFLNLSIPAPLRCFGAVFFYASIFLGGFANFYTYYEWWDLPLHFVSGAALALLGFLYVHMLYSRGKHTLPPLLVAAISFSFAVTVGMLWEIFEFAADNLVGTTMQPSNFDTMTDIIANSLGGLIISTAGYRYIKGQKSFLINSVLTRLYRDNSQFRR